MLDKILQNTYTLSVLKKRVRALKERVNVELFGLKVDPKHQDKEHLMWISSLGTDFFKVFTKDDFEEVFDKLDKQISEISPLVIYFAFDPGPSQTILIGAWLRQNMGKSFIFDIKLDYSLIGGCAFVWHGVYKDYSVKSKLIENKQKLIEGFREYLKQ